MNGGEPAAGTVTTRYDASTGRRYDARRSRRTPGQGEGE